MQANYRLKQKVQVKKTDGWQSISGSGDEDCMHMDIPDDPTDDEWENANKNNNYCGPHCEYLYAEEEHPGHQGIAFTFCTDDLCQTHLGAKQGNGFFPIQRRELKEGDCEWKLHETERLLKKFIGNTATKEEKKAEDDKNVT